MKTLLDLTKEQLSFIAKAVVARKDYSQRAMVDQIEVWNKAEEEMIAYIPTKQADNLRKAKKDRGESQYVDVVVPYSYGMLMSAHTYWCSVFCSRSPIWQIGARHGEGEENVQAIEALIDYQTMVGKMVPALMVWLLDVGKYGIGIIGNHWDEEVHYVPEFKEETISFLGMQISTSKKLRKYIREIPGYKGNKLFNVKPQDYLPDPRVPLTDPDKGEFCGRIFELSYNELVHGKLRETYIPSAVDKVLEGMKSGGSSKENRGSAQIVLPGEDAAAEYFADESGLASKVSVIEMVVEIIPTLWKLGKNDYPEKWVFLVTNSECCEDTVLLARPYGMYHNKFPYRVLECEVDGYSLFKRSVLDISRPMNDILTWLFNSHFHNVRRSINGEVVFDPSRVYASDVLNPDPGKRIRVRPEAYGQDVRTMVHVLPPDASATQTHMRDFQMVAELLQRITGINDGAMGALAAGGRKSATEVRQANTSAFTRLKTQSDYFSYTGFTPLADILIQSTQQLYDGEQKFKVAGSLPNNVNTWLNVTPELIVGNFDYIPVDGSLPMDKLATVNMWTMLLQQAQASPQFAQEYDIGKILAWVAQLAGLKNLKNFKIQVQDPEVIAAKVARGELEAIPNDGMGGPGGGYPGGQSGPAGSLEDLEREAGRVPGLGQTGGMGRIG